MLSSQITDGLNLVAQPVGRPLLVSKNKSEQERIAEGLRVSDELRSEVCCVPAPDDSLYRQLVVTGWVIAYRAAEDLTNRQITFHKAGFGRIPPDEALSDIRAAFAEGQAKDTTWSAHVQFVEQSLFVLPHRVVEALKSLRL